MGEIVAGRKVTLEELRQIALDAKDDITQAAQGAGRDVIIYLHWSAGHYHQFYDDYHMSIDDDGSVHVTCDSLADILAHTWHRNTGAVGISMACGAFCTSNDLGEEAPTDAQVEGMAKVVAVLCQTLEIPIDKDHVITHAEAANMDGYGPYQTWERWDLWFFHNGDKHGTGGDILREKAIGYAN